MKVGIPIESLTSLSAMIHPDVAEKILDGYWPKDGEIPKTYTINLSCRFVGLAHAIGGLDEDALRRLGDIRFALEEYREDGMTEKNLALIRLVLTDGVWSRVVDLPEQLMQQARLQRRHAPVRAAVLAQIAVAVAILTVAPVRLGNLASIRLGENLSKPGGPHSNFWLTFPKYDVKNRTPLQFKLDETVTSIINEYVHDFRPALMRGSNADWLFPGESGSHKEKISFSTQIVERVQKSTGLRITVHQFRHAAGALILKHRPGEYELVRRILGHKSVQTTKNFYFKLGDDAGERDIHRHRPPAPGLQPGSDVTWMPRFNQRHSSTAAVAVAPAPRRASRDRCRSRNGRNPIVSDGRTRAGQRVGFSAVGRLAILPASARPTSPTAMDCTWTFFNATIGSTQPMGAMTLVTPDNVNEFIAELQARVRSVTVWNSVYKLRRAAQLIAPSS